MLHLPLLGGLALAGLPVLLHLLMRQKPKLVRFPAFRFLQQRAKTNQRKIRLRHLLLLLLRMLLLALLCVALAWLKGKNQVGAVVLVIDTSPSMEYVAGGKSRLDDAKTRAKEVLDTLDANSRVAVVETGDPVAAWGSVAEARDRIDRLIPRHGAQPITTALANAYRLFADPQGGGEGGAVQRHLYIFSDRTPNSWEPDRVADLQAQAERLGEPKVTAVYLDLGIEKPVDVAITAVEVKPAALPANQEVVIRATVTATGQDCDTEVICKLTGELQAERKPIKLAAGQSQEIEFINRTLKPGLYQAEVMLATPDALAPGNSRFVTFEVRDTRKILTITDNEPDALAWELAFRVKGDFECDILRPDQIRGPDDLKPYLAVCLLSVRAPAEAGLWKPLRQYVEQGGHLVVIPGRDEMKPAEYATEDAIAILPGVIQKVVDAPADQPARWEPLNRRHPLLAKFATWREREDIGFLKSPRSASRYWLINPLEQQHVVVRYAGPDKAPALLERLNGPKAARTNGRVLMLTTPLDLRPADEQPPWNDYASTAVNDGFYVVLANELIAYAVGDMDEPAFNFRSGQTVTLPLKPAERFPEYTLDAPGVTGSETRLLREENDADLAIRYTNFAGNAIVSGGNPPTKLAFSLNPPGTEYQLERLPIDEVQRLLGPDTVIAPGQDVPLVEALGDQVGRPLDLFPWLMLAFLGLLGAETVVANRFYKPDATEAAAA